MQLALMNLKIMESSSLPECGIADRIPTKKSKKG